ncbi:MAG TPA: protein phosphatase 2C domain-containing protein [Terricaulis sp.]|nr:protein phosphatase 2C domain-containing protein [Terricaulis sp.]
MMTIVDNGWRLGGASVRGPSHVRSGAPNQDAWLCVHDAPMVISVSDGHGAKAHFRSQRGAELAVRAAAASLQAQIDDSEGAELASAALERWRADVQADIAANPYNEAERALLSAPPLGPYGATLLAAGIHGGLLALMQIGDGDLILGYPDGSLVRPLSGGPVLQGELTFSLCQEDALACFHSAVLWRNGEHPWPDFVFMATDGVSKSFQDDRTFEGEVARLRTHAFTNWDRFLREAPDWLSTVSSRGSGDDATMCVAIRTAP